MIKNKLPAIRVPFVWALVAATGFVGMSGVALAQAMGEGFEPDSNALQDVEVRAQRPNDLQQRRFSNASKTVVGREEIQKYGDTSLEDVLRRQPGVTVPSGDHQLVVWEPTLGGAGVSWLPAEVAEVTPAGVLTWLAG